MVRVLVVDDDMGVLETLNILLESEGYEVVAALGGEKGRALIESDKFDLMISDIRMNPLNGMELLKFAHDTCPEMSVIMLTAYGQVETAIEALQLGAFDYVAKPFKTEKLLATVQRALECKGLMEEEHPAE